HRGLPVRLGFTPFRYGPRFSIAQLPPRLPPAGTSGVPPTRAATGAVPSRKDVPGMKAIDLGNRVVRVKTGSLRAAELPGRARGLNCHSRARSASATLVARRASGDKGVDLEPLERLRRRQLQTPLVLHPLQHLVDASHPAVVPEQI